MGGGGDGTSALLHLHVCKWFLAVPCVKCVVLCASGEMALPQYTGRVTDWIAKEEAPEAFANAITVMAVLTIAGLVYFTFPIDKIKRGYAAAC